MSDWIRISPPAAEVTVTSPRGELSGPARNTEPPDRAMPPAPSSVMLPVTERSPVTARRMAAPSTSGPATVRACALVSEKPVLVVNPARAPMRLAPSSVALAALPVRRATCRLAPALSTMAAPLCKSSVVMPGRLNAPPMVMVPAVGEPTRKVVAVMEPPGTKLPRAKGVPGVSGASATVPPGAARLPPGCSWMLLLASESVCPAPTVAGPVTLRVTPSARLKSPALVKAPRLVMALPACSRAALPVLPVRVLAVMVPPGWVTAPVATRSMVGALRAPVRVSGPVTFSPMRSVSVSAPDWVSAWPLRSAKPPALSNRPSVAMALVAEARLVVSLELPVRAPATIWPPVCKTWPGMRRVSNVGAVIVPLAWVKLNVSPAKMAKAPAPVLSETVGAVIEPCTIRLAPTSMAAETPSVTGPATCTSPPLRRLKPVAVAKLPSVVIWLRPSRCAESADPVRDPAVTVPLAPSVTAPVATRLTVLLAMPLLIARSPATLKAAPGRLSGPTTVRLRPSVSWKLLVVVNGPSRATRLPALGSDTVAAVPVSRSVMTKPPVWVKAPPTVTFSALVARMVLPGRIRPGVNSRLPVAFRLTVGAEIASPVPWLPAICRAPVTLTVTDVPESRSRATSGPALVNETGPVATAPSSTPMPFGPSSAIEDALIAPTTPAARRFTTSLAPAPSVIGPASSSSSESACPVRVMVSPGRPTTTPLPVAPPPRERVPVVMPLTMAWLMDSRSVDCAPATSSIAPPGVSGRKPTVPPGAVMVPPRPRANRSACSVMVRPLGTLMAPAAVRGRGVPLTGFGVSVLASCRSPTLVLRLPKAKMALVARGSAMEVAVPVRAAAATRPADCVSAPAISTSSVVPTCKFPTSARLRASVIAKPCSALKSDTWAIWLGRGKLTLPAAPVSVPAAMTPPSCTIGRAAPATPLVVSSRKAPAVVMSAEIRSSLRICDPAGPEAERNTLLPLTGAVTCSEPLVCRSTLPLAVKPSSVGTTLSAGRFSAAAVPPSVPTPSAAAPPVCTVPAEATCSRRVDPRSSVVAELPSVIGPAAADPSDSVAKSTEPSSLVVSESCAVSLTPSVAICTPRPGVSGCTARVPPPVMMLSPPGTELEPLVATVRRSVVSETVRPAATVMPPPGLPAPTARLTLSTRLKSPEVVVKRRASLPTLGIWLSVLVSDADAAWPVKALPTRVLNGPCVIAPVVVSTRPWLAVLSSRKGT